MQSLLKLLFYLNSEKSLFFPSTEIEFYPPRLLALYSMDDRSQHGFFLHVGGKEIKIKITDQHILKERQIKSEKLTKLQ